MMVTHFPPGRYFPILLLWVLMLTSVGCAGTERRGIHLPSATSPSTDSPATRVAVVTALPSRTPGLTQSPSATPTLVPPSSTPTSTPTPTIPPEARLNVQCLPIMQNLPNGAVLEGTLVLSRKGRPFGYLWNLETGEEILLPDRILGSSVSPNGKWLVYESDLREARTWFRVITADGEVHHSFPNDQEWIIGPWLNNEMFIAYRREKPLWSTVVVNPFTGQWREFKSDYPDIEWLDAPRLWGFTVSVYDPTLTRVVYLANPSDTPNKLSYVIWDLQGKQMIAEFSRIAWSIVEHMPVWSPSGSEFVIADLTREEFDVNYVPDDELYSISRDGEMTKLTNLSAYFTIGVDIRGYVWSPNSRYIAFWMAPDPPAETYPDGPQMQLAVLDTETQMVTLYCIPADFRRAEWEPIWSPNSQQVLVKSLDEEGESRLVIVDIVAGWAVQIAGDVDPMGWMVSTP